MAHKFNSPAQHDLAYSQQIKKEKWHPAGMDTEFRDTLDIAMLHDKYGIPKEQPDEFRLSKFDLNKLIEKQRNNLDLNDSAKKTLDDLAEPIDSKSALIWKDRSFKKDERIRNDNKLAGRIGNIAFDNQIQTQMEERFLKNQNDVISHERITN